MKNRYLVVHESETVLLGDRFPVVVGVGFPSLTAALDYKAMYGGTIYEPWGMETAERVARESKEEEERRR